MRIGQPLRNASSQAGDDPRESTDDTAADGKTEVAKRILDPFPDPFAEFPEGGLTGDPRASSKPDYPYICRLATHVAATLAGAARYALL